MDESKTLRPCDTCGETIPKEPNRSWPQYRKKRFCSRACTSADQSQKVLVKCITCGDEVMRAPSHVRAGIYCSHACRRDVRTFTCGHCGIQFTKRPSQRAGAKIYCGSQCSSLAIRKNRGQGHGRRSPEDLAWKAAVFIRDGRKCQHCGSTERLEAHHVKPIRTNPELRHDVDNGLTLCHQCHYYGVHGGMPNFIHGRYSKKRRSAPQRPEQP